MNLQRLEYSYDDSGNVTRIRDYRNSSQYQCFGYDTHDRLTRAFTGDSTCSLYASTGYGPFDHDYTYDSLHNLTSLDGPAYTYGSGNQAGLGDAGPHAVTAVGSISFGYDDNGNRVSKTAGGSTTSYTYDPQNRLVAVDLPGDPDDVTFVYDADGRRVSRSHGDHSTVYVGGVFEIDRDGSTVTDTRTHYRFGDTMVATRTHSPASVVFLLQDHLGSTTAGFDDTSNTAMFQWYYPYGAERHAVGSLPTEQRYTGQTSDATGNPSGDTGLLFYNARYYDPQVGAFVAADTIVPTTARSVGLNRYVYVADNPVNYTDPSGHNWDPTIHVGNDPANAPQVRFDVRSQLTARAYMEFGTGDPAMTEWPGWVDALLDHGPTVAASVTALVICRGMTAICVVGGSVGVGAVSRGSQGGNPADPEGVATDAAIGFGALGVARIGAWVTRTIKAKFALQVSDDFAAGVSRPAVGDPGLAQILDDIYRPSATVGSGSTADAVRFELQTGQLVGGKSHSIKAFEMARRLERWLRQNPGASASDRAAAQSVIDDLWGALNGR